MAYRWQDFVAELESIHESTAPLSIRLEQNADAMTRLLKNDKTALLEDWGLKREQLNPMPETVLQDRTRHLYLGVHFEPSGFLRQAHDHSECWAIYAMLDGVTHFKRMRRTDDGSRPGYAEVEVLDEYDGGPGAVDIVPVGILHETQATTDATGMVLRCHDVREIYGHLYYPDEKRIERRPARIKVG